VSTGSSPSTVPESQGQQQETPMTWCRKQLKPLDGKYDVGLCSMLLSDLNQADDIAAFIADNMPQAHKFIDINSLIKGLLELKNVTDKINPSPSGNAAKLNLRFSETVQDDVFSTVKSKRKGK
jgi:hypothetical protein